jgi:hypothetical protein
VDEIKRILLWVGVKSALRDCNAQFKNSKQKYFVLGASDILPLKIV